MFGLHAPKQNQEFLGVLCRQMESGQPVDEYGLTREDGGAISNVSHDHLNFGLTGAHSGRLAAFQHPFTIHQTCLTDAFLICSVHHESDGFSVRCPLDERRITIRRHDGDVEMVELPWGLCPRDGGPRAVNVVRSERRTFPTHRCLVPASEFRHKNFSFSLANGDWFYFAGIWRPASGDWPEAYAILTIHANADIAPTTTGRWRF